MALYLLFAEDVSDSKVLHDEGRVQVSGPLVDADDAQPYCGTRWKKLFDDGTVRTER
jgi:hypothetical protein